VCPQKQGALPVRFMAPEGLLRGKCGQKTMIYSVGTFMYQLWTHGNEPYSYYDDHMTTDEILSKVRPFFN
jgi:hypothetical protein